MIMKMKMTMKMIDILHCEGCLWGRGEPSFLTMDFAATTEGVRRMRGRKRADIMTNTITNSINVYLKNKI